MSVLVREDATTLDPWGEPYPAVRVTAYCADGEVCISTPALPPAERRLGDGQIWLSPRQALELRDAMIAEVERLRQWCLPEVAR